jgi:hypothetical protein
MKDLKFIFQQRRQKILEDKIDVTAFSIWFIENFPKAGKSCRKTRSMLSGLAKFSKIRFYLKTVPLPASAR